MPPETKPEDMSRNGVECSDAKLRCNFEPRTSAVELKLEVTKPHQPTSPTSFNTCKLEAYSRTNMLRVSLAITDEASKHVRCLSSFCTDRPCCS
mgnify:CR=1 FL=1